MSDVIAWGGAVQNWRCGVAATVAEVDENWADVTVTSVWQSIGYGFSVNYCSAYVSCDGASGGTYQTVYVYSPNGSTTQVDGYTQTFRVARGTYDRSVEVSASFTMPDFQAGSSYAKATVTVPGKPAEVPDPVSDVAATVADGYATATWTNNADAASLKPYVGVRVAVEVDGSDAGTVELAGTAVSHSVAAVADSRYRFTVTPYNAAGEAVAAASDYAYTTPAAPSAVSAVFADGAVSLSWASNAKWAASHEVWASGDAGSTWALLGTSTGTGYTDADPPAGEALYRVRALTADGTQGAWAVSNAVSTYTSADYPSVTIDEIGTVTDLPVRVTWTATGGSGTVASQSAQMVVDGEVVATYSLTAVQVAANLLTNRLVDGGTATVRITVTNSKGLSTTTSMDFSVAWLPPVAPYAGTYPFPDSGMTVVSIGRPVVDEAVNSYTSDIKVTRNGKELVELSSDQWYDWAPPVNRTVKYTATAYAKNGLTASTEVEAVLESQLGFLSYAFFVIPVPYNQQWTESVNANGESLGFAGENLPTWYPDGTFNDSVTVKFDGQFTTEEHEEVDYFKIFGMAPHCWLRDPLGSVWVGHVQPSWTYKGPRAVTVTLKLTSEAVDYDVVGF